VESRQRQTEDSEHGSELHRWLGPFDGAKQARLRFTVGKTTPREIHIEGTKQRHEEPDEEPDDSPEILDPSA
jgi:hypothetical protein